MTAPSGSGSAMTKSDRRTASNIPYKTRHALEHLVALQRKGRRHWRELLDYAERQHDPLLAMHLAHLRDVLADSERVARNALQGRYEEDGGGEW